MTPEVLMEAFDVMTEAPNGVQKLRELILRLAVRGKLVAQDPRDEPVSQLMKRSAAAAAELYSRGRIGKPRNFAPVADNDAAHALPHGWNWVRLASLGEFHGGGTPSKSNEDYWGGRVPWVSPKDMKRELITDAEDKITERALAETRLKVIPSGSLLIVTRSGILRRTLPVAINAVPCAINQDLKALKAYLPELVEYLRLLLGGYEAIILQDFVKGGTTVQSLVFDRFELHPFPLPPVAEQRRIVAKVSELMSICDQLGERQSKRAALRTLANHSALHTLSSSSNETELKKNWDRLRRDFSFVLDALESVRGLRQAVIQLAVRGMLSPQDPSDEPASIQLERIAAKKLRAAQSRKSGARPLHSDFREVPYPAPSGWSWTTLDGIFGSITDGDHQPPPKTNKGIPFLVIGNVSSGRIEFAGCRFVSKSYYEQLDEARKPRKGDILYTVTGSFGLPILVDTETPFCVQRHIAILKPLRYSSSRFLQYLLESELVFNQAKSRATGIAQKTVSLGTLREILAPLPPEAEQRRIVRVVDELMAFCDQLTSHLTHADVASAHLAASLASHAGAA